MDKIWIILEREYLQRVKKKSFILSTILTPLIFPIFIAITVFVLSTEESEERVIALLDSNNFIEDSTKFQNFMFVRMFPGAFFYPAVFCFDHVYLDNKWFTLIAEIIGTNVYDY